MVTLPPTPRPPLLVLEPSAAGKRISLARARALSAPSEVELSAIKKRLRELRGESLKECKRLLSALARSAKKTGLRLHIARDQLDAARYVRRAARGHPYLLVSSSATLAGLTLALESEGFRLIDTYEAETRAAAPPDSVLSWRPWEAGELDSAAVWESFAPSSALLAPAHASALLGSPLPIPDGRWAAAVGLSAASAEDASLFLVQHTHNITKLLFSARKLFVVGGMERVVRRREDAFFQARCAALFGLQAVLEASEPGAAARADAPQAEETLFEPSSPEEVHLVLLDAGRRLLLRSESRRILECIGCKACRPGCMMGLPMPASPRDALLELILARRGGRGGGARAGAGAEASAPQALYRCTLCDSCKSSCPLEIPLQEQCLALREAAAWKGMLPEVFELQRESVLTKGNPLGEAPSARNQFYPRLPDGSLPPGARLGGGAPVLLYLGCVASFQRQRIVESAFRVLSAAGREFSVLGEKEICCGYPLHASGAKEFEDAARRCLGAILASGARTVVTTCAGCFKALSKIYPEHFDMGIEVMHLVEYLERLVNSGELVLSRAPFRDAGSGPADSKAVAYHDPCDLGRAMGLYEPPRALLAAIPGLRPVEFRFNRQASRCCGAGGGAKGFDPRHSEEMALKRMSEAAAMGAELVASACPACLANLQLVTPAVRRETGKALRFMDMTELVARALGPG